MVYIYIYIYYKVLLLCRVSNESSMLFIVSMFQFVKQNSNRANDMFLIV